MKIIVIGGTGLIGCSVVDLLKKEHEVLTAGRNKADITLDMTDTKSIKAMYESHKNIDAIVVTSGKVHFGQLNEMDVSHYQLGLDNKLMGQINVVTIGQHYLNDHGSFTLTSGILNREPIVLGASAAMVNGALDGFTKAAAIELPRGIRINCISPTVITEALDNYGPYFKGFIPVDAATCAKHYQKSVEGAHTGQIYIAG